MTLELQKFLHDGGTLEHLEQDLAIQLHHHAELPLVGLSYHQLDSPKTHPIVRESRGILLEKNSWRVVAKGFNRFFNLGEVADEYKTFNWSSFDAYTKADGSLMLMYHYNGQWHVKTRGSFGEGRIQNPLGDYSPSFSELFWDIMKGLGHDPRSVEFRQKFDPDCTYVFEMCSKFNKVVRIYDQPIIFLLTVVHNPSVMEWPHDESDNLADQIGIARVDRHHFTSLDEIQDYIKHLEDVDPTNEGLVICDDKWLRYKVKSKTYMALHHLFDNGNLFNPKRLVPWALKDDPSELLLYYPEVQEHYDAVRTKMDAAYKQLKAVWERHHQIESQKEFAQVIKGTTPFMGILFQLRKQTGTKSPDGGFAPGPQTEKQLRDVWRDHEQGIIKVLFN